MAENNGNGHVGGNGKPAKSPIDKTPTSPDLPEPPSSPKPAAKKKDGRSKPRAKQQPGRRSSRINNKALTFLQEARRREIVHLRLRGFGKAEIAKKLKMDRHAVDAHLAAVERAYHEQINVDWKQVREREILQLTEARQMAMDAYLTAANRHGETLQPEYMRCFLQASKQLAELQQLSDPATAITINADQQNQDIKIQIIEIGSREELEEIQALEVMQASRYKALLEKSRE